MRLIRTLTILLFVELAMLLNYLRRPYFVIAGIFYLEPLSATVLTLMLVVLSVAMGYAVFRQRTWAYHPAQWFSMTLLINSLANLAMSIFFAADIAGYLARVLEEGVLGGFLLMQLAFIFVNLWIFVAVRYSRKVFNR